MKCVLCSKDSENFIQIKDYSVCDICFSDAATKRVVNKFLGSFSKTIEDQEKALKSFHKLISKKNVLFEQEELISKVSKKFSGNIVNKTHLIKSIKNMSIDEVGQLSEKIDHNDIKEMKAGVKVPFLNPKELSSKMDEVIIGQDEAKIKIANALSIVSCRTQDKRIKKPNIFISGPTGSGKTEFARFIQKTLKLPLVNVDATKLTSSGYEGQSVNDLLFNMVMTYNNGDVRKAENSIIFIDEIDKKTRGLNKSDVGTFSVQQELLKVLEDGSLEGTYNKEKVGIRTGNILFIVAGAFSSLNNDNVFSKISDDDLIDIGIMPEFLGRFPIVTSTKKLTKSEMKQILTQKKNNVLFTSKILFSKFKVNLEFSDDFIDEAIDETVSSKIGARILDKIILDKINIIYFDIMSYYGKTILLKKNSEIQVT